MGTFLHVLSEQYRTEHFFGAERSVLTEHLDPMFPRTLALQSSKKVFEISIIIDQIDEIILNSEKERKVPPIHTHGLKLNLSPFFSNEFAYSSIRVQAMLGTGEGIGDYK